MLNVSKLGYLVFAVQDLPKMKSYYSDVLGLTVVDEEADTVHLSLGFDHQSIVLRKSATESGLSKIGFQIEPQEASEVVNHFSKHNLRASVNSYTQPGIGQTIRTENPDGIGIEFYSEFMPVSRSADSRGVSPVKLSHVAALCKDVNLTRSYYTDVLGFRFSDSVEDYFYFLRCGADHHTINLISGENSGLQHFAFELLDASHLNRASDELHRHGVELLWGPVRHGAGHNLATYHVNPEDHIVELCAELDRMSNEGLGYFDPRPYHEDSPQRPKRWDGMAAGKGVWGQAPPPERMRKGVLRGRPTK
jgi:catechol 2,3-dioxygenase-like lactoylglutathione lyase family enzyme